MQCGKDGRSGRRPSCGSARGSAQPPAAGQQRGRSPSRPWRQRPRHDTHEGHERKRRRKKHRHSEPRAETAPSQREPSPWTEGSDEPAPLPSTATLARLAAARAETRAALQEATREAEAAIQQAKLTRERALQAGAARHAAWFAVQQAAANVAKSKAAGQAPKEPRPPQHTPEAEQQASATGPAAVEVPFFTPPPKAAPPASAARPPARGTVHIEAVAKARLGARCGRTAPAKPATTPRPATPATKPRPPAAAVRAAAATGGTGGTWV
jgi:hypothetical protein